MIYVALHKPEVEGNIGAVARIMKNFNFSDLVIIDPSCDFLSEESRKRSKHAVEILENAKVYTDYGFVKKFNLVIGTTGIVGTDYNVLRSPIEISKFISGLSSELSSGLSGFDAPDNAPEDNSRLRKLLADKRSKILLLFGPEGTGLTNEELKFCDYLITIPTSKNYRALNLSHAVGIVLYEFSKILGVDDKLTGKKSGKIKSLRNSEIVDIAEKSEKDRLYKYASESKQINKTTNQN